MKISEAMQQACEINPDSGTTSICMPEFIMSITGLMLGLDALNEDDDEKQKILWEKADEFTFRDAWNHTRLFVKIKRFFDWFIELEAESEDDLVLRRDAWYDFNFVAEKWNQYVKEKR